MMRGLVAALALAAGHAAALPLWTVAGDGNTIYLLGSVHFLTEKDHPLPAAIDEVYERAAVVVMELDLDDIDPLAVAGTTMRLAMDPGQRGLAELLGAPAWEQARRAAGELDLDINSLAAFEPWFAALSLTQMRLLQLGFRADLGIEQYLLARAREDGRRIEGLETLDAQLGALDGLPAGVQREFLLASLEEAAEIDTQMGGIVAAWRAGDLDTMAGELLRGMESMPDVRERVLVARNRQFADGIAALSGQPRDYLVVVGALHLVGEDNVIEILRARGLRATRYRR